MQGSKLSFTSLLCLGIFCLGQLASAQVDQTSMAQQSKPSKGFFRRALGAGVKDVSNAAMAVVGASIGNRDIELPPDSEVDESWPFRAPPRKTIYTVYWADGSQAKLTSRPDGGFTVFGGSHTFNMFPQTGGVYALLGEDGTMGTLTPRLDGGYNFSNADGSTAVITPRSGGGYVIQGQRGALATIVPGPAGSTHVFPHTNNSSSLVLK